MYGSRDGGAGTLVADDSVATSSEPGGSDGASAGVGDSDMGRDERRGEKCALNQREARRWDSEGKVHKHERGDLRREAPPMEQRYVLSGQSISESF